MSDKEPGACSTHVLWEVEEVSHGDCGNVSVVFEVTRWKQECLVVTGVLTFYSREPRRHLHLPCAWRFMSHSTRSDMVTASLQLFTHVVSTLLIAPCP